MTLCPIALHAQKYPNHLAIICNKVSVSYEKLDQFIDFTTHYLTSLNLPKQAKVAFSAEPLLETVALFFALWLLNMIACPLSPRLPEKAIESAKQRLKVSFFLFPSHLAIQEGVSMEKSLDPKSLATCLFTSGTTKEPKIACQSIDNHMKSALASIDALNLSIQDRYFAPLPFSHIGGIAILWRVFLSGATLVIQGKKDSLQGITHVSYVPTQLYQIIHEDVEKTKEASKLKCLLIGGAMLSPALYQRAQENGCKLYISYGMTETCSLIALRPPNQKTKILPHLELKIMKGEIFVRGASLFQGYLKSTNEIELPLTQGWFATGDLGEITEEGLKVLGRKDHLFISGGENIQPAEIEQALLQIPGVEQAFVRAASDPVYGNVGYAYLFDPSKKWDADSIKNKLREILPSYKIPKKFFFLKRTYEKQEIKSLHES